MRFTLQRVHVMPKVLAPGVLYVSEEFGTAAHLCASGCGEKIRTPLGTEEWQVSLTPSVGSWQLPCRSHYWITAGDVRWAPRWTQAQIEAGRHNEHQRRLTYFEIRNSRAGGVIGKVTRWIKRVFRKS